MKLPAFFSDIVNEALGEPVPIRRVIEQYPDLRVELPVPANSISAYGSVVSWHDWGKAPVDRWPRRPPGTLLGWKYYAGDSYRSFTVQRPEFEQFGSSHLTENWQCDIQTVTGLAFSKSELTEFQSLDAMVESKSPEMIDAITEEKLQANLAHNEIRILRPGSVSDHFARYLWDGGRIFLMNDGGSHHFAAARYIAARLERPVPLSGSLYTFGINPAALEALRADFDMFAISHDAAPANAFRDSMEKYRATYLSQYLPRPYDQHTAILLPRSEPRSAKVAAVLRENGFFDLGEHLGQLVAKQAITEAYQPAAAVTLSPSRQRPRA